METFAHDVPTGWTANDPELVESVDQQGRVHSGSYAVTLRDDAVLSQTISIDGGCYYDFSFFARGEGANVALEATVTFIDGNNNASNGLTLSVRAQDLTNSNRNFAYFRGITGIAPNDAVSLRVSFRVTAQGNQSLDLDDVSLSVN